jgi:hypothetical protein
VGYHGFFDGTRWVRADAAALFAVAELFGFLSTLLATLAALFPVVSLRFAISRPPVSLLIESGVARLHEVP